MFRTLFEGPWLIIIIVVVLLLFGAPKLPGLARSLGQSLRIFRGEMKNMKDDAQSESTAEDVKSDSDATQVKTVQKSADNTNRKPKKTN